MAECERIRRPERHALCQTARRLAAGALDGETRSGFFSGFASRCPGLLPRSKYARHRPAHPRFSLRISPAAVTVSISHRSGAAICAVAMSGVDLGCDQEVIEPRSEAFVADYFTEDEQALVARVCEADRSRLVTLLWSAKESALKALREGLRLDTRSVDVSPVDGAFDLNGWRPLRVCADGRSLPGLVATGAWYGADICGRSTIRPADSPPGANSHFQLLPPGAGRGLVIGMVARIHFAGPIQYRAAERSRHWPIDPEGVCPPDAQRPTPARLELARGTEHRSTEETGDHRLQDA